MTREEAITILDCERPYGSCGCGATDEEIEEALDMAIKALEQEPCDMKQRVEKEYLYESLCEDLKNANAEIKRLSEHCEDAISRQAVNILVDELARAISDERCCISRGRSTATIMQDILDLPSVNPQEPILDKIRAEVKALNQDYYCEGDFDKCKDYVLDIIDEYRGD